jgi:predicted alpha/beta superfamily hydrolase
MDNQLLQIQNRTCRIYGTASAEYLLLQMANEHDLAGMERETEAIRRQAAHTFLLVAVQVENWIDDLSPWPAPPVWGKQGFVGRAGNTLAWLEQAVPGISQQYSIKEDCKVILGGYSLAGLFALWAATQTNALYGVAAASPSVWFPGWPEFEAAHPIQAQRVYLSLGDREEYTRNQTMAAVGDNIRALHTALTRRGTACTLEWNEGGHFKDTDLRTARALVWTMESGK